MTDEERGELLQLSWVPIYRGRLSMDVGFLAKYVEQLRSEGPGVDLSNRGGWQSHDLLAEFQRDERRAPVLAELETLMRQFVESYKTQREGEGAEVHPFELEICNLWANLNGRGDFNATHHHPGAHISGVFYAKAHEDCGQLTLRPPYSFFDVVLDHCAQPSVQPEAGLVVLFPSDVDHSTEPNWGSEERISFSFNARYRPITPSGRTIL